MPRVKSSIDVPKGHHYCLLIYKTKSVHHEGDKRSRINPGHGYPAYTEEISSVEQWVFADLEEAGEFIECMQREHNRWNKMPGFCLFEVNKRMEVSTKVVVE